MPVCKVGCDDFFEKGYLIVDQGGVIQINEQMKYSDELKALLSELEGKRCTYFSQETEGFFSYKRGSLKPD